MSASLPAPGSRRPAFVLLWAVAAALLLASPAVAKKKPKQPKEAPKTAQASGDTSEVLYRIGSQTITRNDVQKRIEELPESMRSNFSTPEGRQQLLDRMVEERLWLQVATQAGVPDRPKVQAQLAQQRRDLVMRTYLTEMMAGNPAPSDSAVQAYYDAHLGDFKVPATVAVRHIQTKTKTSAVNVLKLARGGSDWNKLCMKYSVDSVSRGVGGNLGSVTHDGNFPTLGRQPALADSAFALEKRKVGGPYKTDKGWHVLKVDEVREETIRPIEQTRPMITRQLQQQGAQDFYKAHLDSARKALGVTPDSAAIQRYVSQKKDAHEMFREAQEKVSAEERVAAYEKVVAEYPDSDVSPQAQFMVGFIYSEELKKYDEADAAFRQLLTRYPHSELAASAQWMVEHMRSEEAPQFIESQADSIKSAPQSPTAPKKSAGKQ